jgi:hypothetical protein
MYSRVQRSLLGVAASLLLLCGVLLSGSAATITFDPFQRTWARTDKPVLDGTINRTWMWGLQSNAYMTTERYTEAPDGERTVIYFDKSRMEITDPYADRNDPWFVTNGLLVVELVTGRLQLGHDTFEQRTPAQVNVAGDGGDPTGPTYATFSTLVKPHTGEQPTRIVQTVDRAGNVAQDNRYSAYNIGTARWVPETQHWIASPFWEFMNSTGPVWESDRVLTEALFEPWYYATGLPITEAYWANVRIAGEYMDVLIQCFERRCLTYTPDNPAGWQVEAGNVGLHYYIWRYGEVPPKPVG